MAVQTIAKVMERLTNKRLAVGMTTEHIKKKVTKKENKK